MPKWKFGQWRNFQNGNLAAIAVQAALGQIGNMEDDNQLRALRKARGLTQIELAELAGMHQTQLSSLERSVRRLNIENARKIAEALGVPLVALFGAQDWVLPKRSAAPPSSAPTGTSRLMYWRREKGLSQQALADLVGVSKMSVSALERGKMRLDIGYLRRFSTALEISVADLLDPSDNPYALDDRERELIDLIRELPEGRRQDVLRMTKALRD